MDLKTEIKLRYEQLVADRIDVLQDLITGLAQGAQNDAKGSAGDKHETSLSMMHLEQEKLAGQLREAIEQKQILEQLRVVGASKYVALGSAARSGHLIFYLSVALPKITCKSYTVFALSPQSPVGRELLGKSAGHQICVAGKTYKLEEVF